MSNLLIQTGFEEGACGLPAAAHEVLTGIILFHDAKAHPLLVPAMKRVGVVFDAKLEGGRPDPTGVDSSRLQSTSVEPSRCSLMAVNRQSGGRKGNRQTERTVTLTRRRTRCTPPENGSRSPRPTLRSRAR